MPETHTSTFCVSADAISLKYMHLYVFITRKLHYIKFIVDMLSLISILFIPHISYEIIRLYNQVTIL